MLFARSQKKLFIVAGALLGVTLLVVLLRVFSGPSQEEVTGLPKFDTASVTAIKMTPKGGEGEILFEKKDGKWLIKPPGKNGKTLEASSARITELISLLSELRVINLVARTAADKGKFGLDTGYTSVTVMAGDDELATVMIGKAEMLGPQEMGSYVRSATSDDIYLVSGFLDMSFNADITVYRNRELGFGGAESWSEIRFTGKENFVITRSGTDWLLDGKKADSAKVTGYLATFASLEGNEFADEVTIGKDQKPVAKLEVRTVSGREFAISAFVAGRDTVVASTLAPGSLFKAGGVLALYGKLFPGRAGLK